jgi:hypothetical protein
MKLIRILSNDGSTAVIEKFEAEIVKRASGTAEDFLNALKPGAVLKHGEQPGDTSDPKPRINAPSSLT